MAEKKKDDKKAQTPEDALAADPALKAIYDRLDAATAAGGNDKQFLGLPSGDQDVGVLEVDRPGQTAATPGKKPRYYQSYAYMPQIMNWTPVQKRQLQTRLVNSGLLTEDYLNGAWDDNSSQAFAKLLSMANYSGNDWETELYNVYNSQPMEIDPRTGQLRPKKAKGMRERQPLKLSLTHPDDLTRVAQETATKRLGRKFTPDEMSRFVASYQGEEKRAQTAAWNAEYEGGTVTEPISAETAALKSAEAADPVAFQTRSALPLVDSVNEMLGGLNFGQTKPMGG